MKHVDDGFTNLKVLHKKTITIKMKPLLYCKVKIRPLLLCSHVNDAFCHRQNKPYLIKPSKTLCKQECESIKIGHITFAHCAIRVFENMKMFEKQFVQTILDSTKRYNKYIIINKVNKLKT